MCKGFKIILCSMHELSLALFAQTLCVNKWNQSSRLSPSEPRWYYGLKKKRGGKKKRNQFYLRSFTIWWKCREEWNPDPQSAFLCSVRQSCHLSPPASTRKYYDCIKQTIFTCKKRPTSAHDASNRRTYHIRWSISSSKRDFCLIFLFKEGQRKCLHSAV